jgi:hypothetical protein
MQLPASRFALVMWHQLSSCGRIELPVGVHLQDTKPIFIRESYKGADKLKDKVAIITGGACMQTTGG